MKNLVMIVGLMASTATFAQPYQAEVDMEKMMAQMKKYQTCIKGVDQSKLEAFERRANQHEAKVTSLCASGKRAQAEAMATSFYEEIERDPTLKVVLKCGELITNVMPSTDLEKDESNQHVCDIGPEAH